MPTTKANQRAVAKYVKQNYDRIEVKVPKGQKAFIQTAADVQGESVNAFVTKAIEERIEQMKANHTTCPVCGVLLFRARNGGSPQVYCSAVCRKQAFNMRKREEQA